MSKLSKSDIKNFNSRIDQYTMSHGGDIRYNLIKEEHPQIKEFWDRFVQHMRSNQHLVSNIVDSNAKMYKYSVFDLLLENKNKNLTNDDLMALQMEIENMSCFFDEESIYSNYPNMINKLIKPDKDSAKDFLKNKLTNQSDIDLISELGHYTIEALIVYVFGGIFHNPETLEVRVASMIEQLDSAVRRQALLLKERRLIKMNMTLELTEEITSKTEKYAIGNGLVYFLLEREMIKLNTEEEKSVLKKGGSYYTRKHTYVVCNFESTLLPMNLNLPMVCKPQDWQSSCGPGIIPDRISDLSGGYFKTPIYNRFSLLSTKNMKHFYLRSLNSFSLLCGIMNKLQNQPFQINSSFLNYIDQNRNSLVSNGLLIDSFYTNIHLHSSSKLLRDFYMKDEKMHKLCSYSKLVQRLSENIQRARYEALILKLASAYEGYTFYLPVFLDFRGRMYRSGILHFHERDLARSLILFADNEKVVDDTVINRVVSAIPFHYTSFPSYDLSSLWFKDILCLKDVPFSHLASRAKRPLQLLSNIVSLKNNYNVNSIPITQDASASAYQIMSYFMLDEEMAIKTNLISQNDSIKDVYKHILDEIKDYMKSELDSNLANIVCKYITRKDVKMVFMPKIYGKTLMSTAHDLRDVFSQYLTSKECFVVASACFQFWKTRYADMECLIRMIRNIGWIASAGGRPVFYSIDYFETVQDYMIMEPIYIWVYDRVNRKRRKVTMKVSSLKRDRRKTAISTFVNFIHQKDAFIAMNVVKDMLDSNAPIYTVHDNFISSAKWCGDLPKFYCDAFEQMGPPLSIINKFLYDNVFYPVVTENEDNYSIYNVYASSLLNEILNRHIPTNISKIGRKSWEEKISVIVKSYENYTRIVCGSSAPTGKGHIKKWESFIWQMRRASPNYSVHY